MCGICGEITFDGSIPEQRTLERMMNAMAPRGPDAQGHHLAPTPRGGIALGHRRLKIIDLTEAGNQPLHAPDLELSIVFNGCVYNHLELRRELEQQGQRFHSHSDTEVILRAYHVWGKGCVERFRGMFAFAIVEWRTGRTVLARDRLGIKPLYYDRTPQRLRFASTLPALLAAGGVGTDLDPVALHHYLTFHAVVPAPYTILQGVRKLPPATVRTVEPDGSQEDWTYWTLKMEHHAEDRAKTPEEWQEELLEALRQAVRYRLVADVPVGVLLSGGLDSSLVVGLIAEEGGKAAGLETFSVGFESVNGVAGDEFQYSDVIADHFGTSHHRIVVPTKEMLEALPATIAAMSEPMVSHDAVGFYLLSREVAKHVKVVQSGQGADEVFGGYHWYPPLLEQAGSGAEQYARLFCDRDHADYTRLVNPRWVGGDYSRALIQSHFDTPGADGAADRALRLDTTVMLVDDPVKRVDNMTMAWGLEARVPFLDHHVVELAGRIPAALKVGNGGKWVLKEAARRVIPAAVIDRPKGYFPVPALKYLQGSVLEYVRQALEAPAARQRGIFRPERIDQLLRAPGENITPLGGSMLWQAGLLELWLQSQGL